MKVTLAKISEEVEYISRIYTERFSITRNKDWYILKLQEEVGELTKAYLSLQKQSRIKDKSTLELRKDLADEIADVFSQTLLIARYHNIDIEKAVQNKWLKYKS